MTIGPLTCHRLAVTGFPNRSICDRTDSVAALTANVRTPYFAALVSGPFCVQSTGWTLWTRHSGSPQSASESDRKTVPWWYFGDGPRFIACVQGSDRVRREAGMQAVVTHQRMVRARSTCCSGRGHGCAAAVPHTGSGRRDLCS